MVIIPHFPTNGHPGEVLSIALTRRKRLVCRLCQRRLRHLGIARRDFIQSGLSSFFTSSKAQHKSASSLWLLAQSEERGDQPDGEGVVGSGKTHPRAAKP